jgi:hypothetical protein
MKKGIAVSVAVVALGLLLPSVWYLSSDSLRRGEEQAAFERVATVPLNQVESLGSLDLTVKVPDDADRRRIRRFWGDPGYLIAAVSDRKHIYCFERLGLTIQARVLADKIALEAAKEPLYGYSAECQSDGLKFRAPPGATLQLHVVAEGDRDLPSGNLIVTGYWTGETKDRIVGMDLDDDLRKLSRLIAISGGVMLVCAAWLFARQRSRAKA